MFVSVPQSKPWGSPNVRWEFSVCFLEGSVCLLVFLSKKTWGSPNIKWKFSMWEFSIFLLECGVFVSVPQWKPSGSPSFGWDVRVCNHFTTPVQKPDPCLRLAKITIKMLEWNERLQMLLFSPRPSLVKISVSMGGGGGGGGGGEGKKWFWTSWCITVIFIFIFLLQIFIWWIWIIQIQKVALQVCDSWTRTISHTHGWRQFAVRFFCKGAITVRCRHENCVFAGRSHRLTSFIF